MHPLVRTLITRLTDEGPTPTQDALVSEEPLEVRVNGESVAVTMRTPGDDADLVRGFLLTEGIIRTPQHILRLQSLENPDDPAAGNIVNATLPDDVAAERSWRRNTYASSSCGVCGKASIDMVRAIRPRVESDLTVPRDVLFQLPDKLRDAQAVFEATGGLHAAGLFTRDGDLLVLREDVGRHNAVDKVVGWAVAHDRVPLADALLVVSGRAGFEIVQKAAVAGVPVVAAVSAASSLAVRLAEEADVCLVGFLRGRGGNVYAHPERVA